MYCWTRSIFTCLTANMPNFTIYQSTIASRLPRSLKMSQRSLYTFSKSQFVEKNLSVSFKAKSLNKVSKISMLLLSRFLFLKRKICSQVSCKLIFCLIFNIAKYITLPPIAISVKLTLTWVLKGQILLFNHTDALTGTWGWWRGYKSTTVLGLNSKFWQPSPWFHLPTLICHF